MQFLQYIDKRFAGQQERRDLIWLLSQFLTFIFDRSTDRKKVHARSQLYDISSAVPTAPNNYEHELPVLNVFVSVCVLHGCVKLF